MSTAQELDSAYPAILPEAWSIDPEFTFLNHGSFGACPTPVLIRQRKLQARLESNPLRFLVDEAPPLLDRARSAMAGLMGVPSDDVVFVQSATAGVNAVLRSLAFEPGDEILMLSHAYGSCMNVVHHICRQSGAVPVEAVIKWPGSSEAQVIDAVLGAVSPRTKIAMIDHVTSRSGLVMPMRELAEALHARGVDVLVDGAHAPGMMELDVASLGVAYYTGNCHKWLCGPKAAAVLYVRPDRQDGIEPAIISEGSRFDSNGVSYGKLQQRFAWQGTADPTAAICVPDAIEFLSSLLPGGLPALMKRNHDMAVRLRAECCEQWGVPEPCPESMLGSMAAMPIKPGFARWDTSDAAAPQQGFIQSIRDELKIECQSLPFGNPPLLHVRLSCHAYNHGGQIYAMINAFRDHIDPTVYRK